MKISAVFPHSNGYCTELILVVLHSFYVFISFLFIAVRCVIHHSVDSVDFIVSCMAVSAVVRLGMICRYAVIASNQINKNNYGRTLSERPCYILPLFFIGFFYGLVGQTAERIFTKLSHVVDIRHHL